MADRMLIDGLIKFCDEKSKNIKLKAEPQVFIEIKQALEELKALKEKSVAKKVISRNSIYRCPTCESLVSVTQTKCTKCSQKLDWQ